MDTGGLLMRVVVSAADVADRDGARRVLDGVGRGFGRLARAWGPIRGTAGRHCGRRGGRRGQGEHRHRVPAPWRQLERYGPTDTGPRTGFRVVPRRWVEERSLAWLGRNRWLAKDYARLPETGEALSCMRSTSSSSVRSSSHTLWSRTCSPATSSARAKRGPAANGSARPGPRRTVRPRADVARRSGTRFVECPARTIHNLRMRDRRSFARRSQGRACSPGC